jgi:sugar O-acyltransferase (sialic acid O-acetyltransferase NeuD family)
MTGQSTAPAGAVPDRPRRLVLLGAGGFGRETVDVVRAINERSANWCLAGFLDDAAELQGQVVHGTPVLGALHRAPDQTDTWFTLCMVSPKRSTVRAAVAERLALPADRYATLVHPAAAIAPSCAVGVGGVIQAGVVATADVRLGDHVLIMPNVVLTHDDVVEDFATIGAGVCLAGGVRIGPGAYIGSGALIREGCTVGAGALIGMGSIVLDDVPAGQVWCGTPARFLRHHTAPPAADPAMRVEGRSDRD